MKTSVEVAELPLGVNLAGLEVVAFEADRLTPPQPGAADGEDQGEILVPAGEERGPLGE